VTLPAATTTISGSLQNTGGTFDSNGGDIDVPIEGEGIALTLENRIFEDGDNKLDESEVDNRITENNP